MSITQNTSEFQNILKAYFEDNRNIFWIRSYGSDNRIIPIEEIVETIGKENLSEWEIEKIDRPKKYKVEYYGGSTAGYIQLGVFESEKEAQDFIETLIYWKKSTASIIYTNEY